MKARAVQLKSNLEIETGSEIGTKISLEVKIK
jgi:nitrate/nitrite-specific signal transduction histidine kinase